MSKIFSHFSSYSNDELEEFVHDDPAWKSTWDSNSVKKMPKKQETLDYYQHFAAQIVKNVGL